MILTELLPHQQRAVDNLNNTTCAAIFMGKGKGKSLTALALIEHSLINLILSDKTNAETTWVEQVCLHTQYDYILHPTHQQLDEAATLAVKKQVPLCVLTNYEQVYTHPDTYALKWDAIVMDEAALLKNQRTNRSKGVKQLGDVNTYRIMLDGEPTAEGIEDLFGMFLQLDGGERLGKSFFQFRKRYMQPSHNLYGWVPKRSALTRIKEDIEDVTYWSMGEEDNVVMPKIYETTVACAMPIKMKEIDDDLKFKYKASIKGSEQATIETDYAPVVFIKRVQLASGIFRPSRVPDAEVGPIRQALNLPPPPKPNHEPCPWHRIPTPKLGVVRRILEAVPKETPVVLWYTYDPEVELLTEICEATSRKVVVLRGGSNRKKTLEQIRPGPGERPVLIINTALGRGINHLGDALHVFYSRPFSYRLYAQCLGRATRLNAKNEWARIITMYVRGGGDEKVHLCLNDKKSVNLLLTRLV